MSKALDKYVADLETVHQFQQQCPTLAHARRALGKNGRLSEPEAVEEFIGSNIHNAGMTFLEGIHQEIHDAKPQWEKELIQKDLDELAGKVEDDSPYTPPPLSAETLPAE